MPGQGWTSLLSGAQDRYFDDDDDDDDYFSDGDSDNDDDVDSFTVCLVRGSRQVSMMAICESCKLSQAFGKGHVLWSYMLF